jgi:hypothetical protein
MGMDGCGLAGQEHLVGGRDGRGRADRRRGDPWVAEDQRAALGDGVRVVQDLA